MQGGKLEAAGRLRPSSLDDHFDEDQSLLHLIISSSCLTDSQITAHFYKLIDFVSLYPSMASLVRLH
jgi:hypothetical protein